MIIRRLLSFLNVSLKEPFADINKLTSSDIKFIGHSSMTESSSVSQGLLFALKRVLLFNDKECAKNVAFKCFPQIFSNMIDSEAYLMIVEKYLEMNAKQTEETFEWNTNRYVLGKQDIIDRLNVIETTCLNYYVSS